MMLKKYFSEDLSISRKDFLIVFTLLFNALTWSNVSIWLVRFLIHTHTQRLISWVVFQISIVAFMIIGGMLPDKVGRLRLLYAWTLLGATLTLLPALCRDTTITYVTLFSLAMGASVGVGLPSCLAYLADHTRIEERGRVSGVIISSTTLASSLPVLVQPLDLPTAFLILAVWRFLGLIVLPKLEKTIMIERRAITPFSSVLRHRLLLLYLIPWIMFCLVDQTAAAYVLYYFYAPGFFQITGVVEQLVGVASAFIGGVLLDWVGRRRMTMFSFAALGLSYAVLALASLSLASWLVYSVIEGLAWGVLTVTFTLVLWADLAPRGAEEKYYVAGGWPLFLASAVGSLLTPVLTPIPASSAFSVACLFLFVAVLPLLFVPETVPDEVFERRRFRGYVEEAKTVLGRTAEG